MSGNEGCCPITYRNRIRSICFGFAWMASLVGTTACYAWDLAVEGDLAINGLASSPAVNGSNVDPSLNPPINWSFVWGDAAAPGAVLVPGGVGVGTDTEINIVNVGGAGAGGGGIDGALVYSMDATEAYNLVLNANAYELAIRLTVHGDHVNVNDDAGVPTDQSSFRVILKDYDGVDFTKPARAQEDINYVFDVTSVARDQSIELSLPLSTPTSFYHDPANGVGDSIANFDVDDPFGAGTGGAFELQFAPQWASHGRFHITLHEIAIRQISDAGLAGDYNGNGVVDAADYTAWRDNLGDSDEADINGNGDGGGIEPSDYVWWKQNYGNSNLGSGGTASRELAGAVPEPHSLALLLIGSLYMLAITRSAVN
jgi:hypothetical protein